MENATKSPRQPKAQKKPQSGEIREKYISYVLEHGSRPPSFFLFAKSLKLREEELYQFYNSFGAIEKDIWRSWFDATIKTLQADEVYAQYTVREKLLSFYFTLLEELKRNRSFVVWQLGEKRRPELTPDYLKSFKAGFGGWAAQLMAEGNGTEEIAKRPFIGDRYHEALWVQTLFILLFWYKDDSQAFEKTDALIEKTVNVAFDLMGRGAVDTVLDLAKFLYQSRKHA